jgi:hypothetical protein
MKSVSDISELPCWVIRQCSGRCDCPVRDDPGRECWEVVGGRDFCLADICSDCLVFVLKQKNSHFSESELGKIYKSRCGNPVHG